MPSPRQFNLFLFIIILLAITIRVYALFKVSIIQKDSPEYLYQAMVIYHGDKTLLEKCGFSIRIKEINFYSLSLIPFYYIFNDWEIAGKFLSLLSSLFSLILLYLILNKVSPNLTTFKYLVLIIYIFNPVIVKESAEIMRESYYTFYILSAIYLFLIALNYPYLKRFLLFNLANLSFLVASWIRVEGLLYPLYTTIFLLVYTLFSKERKQIFISSILYCLTPFLIFLFLLIYNYMFTSFILSEIKGKIIFFNPFKQPIAQLLEGFKYQNIPSPTPYFWDMVKQNLWLIALGTTLFYKFLPALHISNLPLILLGLRNLRLLPQNIYFHYLLFISSLLFLTYYFFTFTKWYMEKRYMLPLLYTLSPILLCGIKRLLQIIENLKNFSIKFIYVVFIVFYFAIALFELSKPIRTDLLFLKKLAETISSDLTHEDRQFCLNTSCPNLIFTTQNRLLFYVSNISGIPMCPKVAFNYYQVKNMAIEDIHNFIKENGFKYVVLERKVFGEKLNILKNKLESSGIKLYIVEN